MLETIWSKINNFFNISSSSEQPSVEKIEPSGFSGDDETIVLDDGNDETVVLEDDNEETVLLDETEMLEDYVPPEPIAYLLRESDGERFQIKGYKVTIGKDAFKSDVPVSSVNTVSRCHAVITYEDDQHYIMDNDSTNGTAVNHKKIERGTRTAINNGDSISLSKEDFTFYVDL